MTYLIVGLILLFLCFIYKRIKQPLSVSSIKNDNGFNRYFLISKNKEESSLTSSVEPSATTSRYIDKMEAIDIEAPQGMAFVAVNSSEFMNSSFALSNFNEIHIGDSFHGLKLLKIKGKMASISYKGFIRLIDLSPSPIISIEGVVVRLYPFSPDGGDEVKAISIEGLMFHSKTLRTSFGLKVIKPNSFLDELPFTKIQLMQEIEV